MVSKTDNYFATVVKINSSGLIPLKGLDRLCHVNIFGNKVLVSNTIPDGTVGVFFPLECQISHDFLKANNLYRDSQLNQDTSKKGYFEDSGRVKAQKFQGHKSMGFFIELSSLSYLGLPELPILGTEFNSIDNKVVCKKYVVKNNVPSTKVKAKADKVVKVSQLVDNQFRLHYDTSQFGRNLHMVEPNDYLTITNKLHGCLPSYQTINMADGTQKRIKDIKVGDFVLGYDHITNTLVESEVLNTFINGKTERWLKISKYVKISNLGKAKRSLIVTPNHQIFIKGKGYISASETSIGDVVLNYYSDFMIDNVKKSILTGILLGDGYLDKQNNKYAIRYGHKKEHEGYVDYINELLGNFCTQNKRYRTSGYGTEMVDSSTKQSQAINSIFGHWIVDGQKEVPSDVELDKYSLAFWYMDDGSLGINKNTFQANFAVCGFSDVSCENLSFALNKLGFNNYVFYKNGKYNRLRFNWSDAEKLFIMIADLIPPIMQYKLPPQFRNKFVNMNLPDSEFFDFVQDGKITRIDEMNPKTFCYRLKYDIETTTNNFFAGEILVHNSSHVSANILTKRINLTWLERFAKWLGIQVVDTQYGNIYSSRKVIKNEYINQTGNHYYNVDIWGIVNEYLKMYIPQGFTLYCEIVGYLPSGETIQKDYDYGCERPKSNEVFTIGKHCKVYIYRVTITNPKGNVYELSAPEVQVWCKENGLLAVPLLWYGKASELGQDGQSIFNTLEGLYLEKDCNMCINKVPAEGIVIRISDEAYKMKSFAFYQRETKELDSGIINLEDNQEEG